VTGSLNASITPDHQACAEGARRAEQRHELPLGEPRRLAGEDPPNRQAVPLLVKISAEIQSNVQRARICSDRELYELGINREDISVIARDHARR